MKKKLLFLFGIFLFLTSCTSQDEDDKMKAEIHRVTNEPNIHQAFTDLVFFDNQFFLTFRESDKHVGGIDGVIKILSSFDGENWKLIKQFSVPGIDLRDPKFSLKNEDLMLYFHGNRYENKELVGFSDYVSSYTIGDEWNALKDVVLENTKILHSKIQGNKAWPWRINWYNGNAYAFGYGQSFFGFYSSGDGLKFQNVSLQQNFLGWTTEATIEIDDKGVFYAICRRMEANAKIGRSTDLGITWDWFAEIPIRNFAGPDFVFYKNGVIIGGGDSDKLILGYYNFETNNYKKLMTLPTRGDSSYPGMLIKDNILWMSYYSGQDGNGTSIYLAKIKLDEISL